jgi:hypothetical protein
MLLAGMLLPASALTIIPDPEGEKKYAAMVEHNPACISHLQKVTDLKSADAAAKAGKGKQPPQGPEQNMLPITPLSGVDHVEKILHKILFFVEF